MGQIWPVGHSSLVPAFDLQESIQINFMMEIEKAKVEFMKGKENWGEKINRNLYKESSFNF